MKTKTQANIKRNSLAGLSAGALLMMVAGAAATAQVGGSAADEPGAGYQRLVLPELAHINWLEESDVAALREGVLEKMELKAGMPVKRGGEIGFLHRRSAELTVEKAKRQVEANGPQEKAKAEVEVATAVCARDQILNKRRQDMVAAEEVAKHLGEYKVALASSQEAAEKHAIDRSDLDLAQQALDEHTIRAPYDGVITKVWKDPGESVRANEAVVKMGNLNRLAADCYVPIDYADRIKEGLVVEIQPKSKARVPLAVEKKQFRGKITFVDPQIQAIGETAVHIRAEFDNPGWQLRPGLEGILTIYLPAESAAAGSPPANDGTRTARNNP